MAMQQLSLFDETPAVKPTESPLVCQLDLFTQSSLGMAQAAEWLRQGDMQKALDVLTLWRNKLPQDRRIGEQVDLLVDVFRRHQALEMLPLKSRAVAKLGLARKIPVISGGFQALRDVLVQSAVREWCVTTNDFELIEGRLLGEWFFSSGALDEALVSFERAAQKQYDARVAFRWGDALTARGQTGPARHRYRDALLLDPHHEAWNDVRDTAVRQLPDLARYEVGIDDEPITWAAPVGIVMGLLPRPSTMENIEMSTHRESLQRARRFTRGLVKLAQPENRKDAGLLIEIRREMKNACPELFALFLQKLR